MDKKILPTAPSRLSASSENRDKCGNSTKHYAANADHTRIVIHLTSTNHRRDCSISRIVMVNTFSAQMFGIFMVLPVHAGVSQEV